MPIINIKNIDINYIKKGQGNALVFLHGIFNDSTNYTCFIDILSEKYTVYAIDIPMHGKSGKPRNYVSIKDISLILKEFIKGFGIKQPIIYAHSAGSMIAMTYAAENKVNELVLIEPAGLKYYNSRFSLQFNLFIKNFYYLFYHPIKSLKVIRTSLRNFIRNIFNKNFWKLFNDNLSRNYLHEMNSIKCSTNNMIYYI